MLLLVKHSSRQRQHAPKDNLAEQVGAAFDLEGNVADDTAEIGSERLQGPVGALELLGVGIALMLDLCELAQPRAQKIGLSRLASGRIAPSDATTESRRAIQRNPQNETASFCAVKARKLPISTPVSPGKPILDQPLGWFFTDD
ncbi:hypothetical protein AC628_12565 [Bradyrhizobium sp. NAS96.2]|nr:hypothetical protein AC628_12565 [Bradyrhizobium sp. NAS96.2]